MIGSHLETTQPRDKQAPSHMDWKEGQSPVLWSQQGGLLGVRFFLVKDRP